MRGLLTDWAAAYAKRTGETPGARNDSALLLTSTSMFLRD